MKTKGFDYNADWSVMPHDPAESRGESCDSGRLIMLNCHTSKIEHTVFRSIRDYFQPGDLLVLNDIYMLLTNLWFQSASESTQVTVYGHGADSTTVVQIKSDQLSVKPELVQT